jgi:hypothetical protein
VWQCALIGHLSIDAPSSSPAGREEHVEVGGSLEQDRVGFGAGFDQSERLEDVVVGATGDSAP